MTEHTKLPWAEDRHIYWLNQPGEQEHHGGWTVTDDHDGLIIATVNEDLPNFRANAAYIVKACNAYPAIASAALNWRTGMISAQEAMFEIDAALSSPKET